MSDVLGSLSSAPDVPTCSRAGCRDEATWQVVWRNPRIHAPDRRKVWVACEAHRDYLRDYLAARDFPVGVEELTDTSGSRGPS